jgi:hypothetical protein
MQSLQLKSPVAGKLMEPVLLENGLEVFHCIDMGGHYIPAQAYLQWLKQQPAHLPHLS